MLQDDDTADNESPQQQARRVASLPGTPSSMVAASPSKKRLLIDTTQSSPRDPHAGSMSFREANDSYGGDVSPRNNDIDASEEDGRGASPHRSLSSTHSEGGLRVQTAFDPFSARYGSPISRFVVMFSTVYIYVCVYIYIYIYSSDVFHSSMLNAECAQLLGSQSTVDPSSARH